MSFPEQALSEHAVQCKKCLAGEYCAEAMRIVDAAVEAEVARCYSTPREPTKA